MICALRPDQVFAFCAVVTGCLRRCKYSWLIAIYSFEGERCLCAYIYITTLFSFLRTVALFPLFHPHLDLLLRTVPIQRRDDRDDQPSIDYHIRFWGNRAHDRVKGVGVFSGEIGITYPSPILSQLPYRGCEISGYIQTGKTG